MAATVNTQQFQNTISNEDVSLNLIAEKSPEQERGASPKTLKPKAKLNSRQIKRGSDDECSIASIELERQGKNL